MIAIVNYGIGNLLSVLNMLKKCGIDACISSDEREIQSASKIILPGVGAFDAAMQKLNSTGLGGVLKQEAASGKPLLGICLGAQLLLDRSEEGNLPGLSLISGKCQKFNPSMIAPLRVPHIGWTDVKFVQRNHSLSNFPESLPRFYFTHSYFLQPTEPEHILSVAKYGHEFVCGVAKGNVMGVQFHPEKSHRFGFNLFTNFVRL